MPGSIVDRIPVTLAVATRRWQFRPALWPTLATLALVPVLLWLGWWQLGRAEFKDAQYARVQAENARPPVELDAGLREAAAALPESWDQRRVKASGHYLPRHFLLDNRTFRGAAGYHVLTPLVLDEGPASGVMINRGWVPLGSRRERLPETSVPGETLEVRGRSRVSGDAFLLGEAGYRSESWPRVVQSIELEKMEEALGIDLFPFVVELDRAEPHGYQREWRIWGGIGPQRHRAYAFQWFALAATLLAIYVIVNTRRR